MPKPKPRRDGREAALQFLFSHDLNKLDESDDDEIDNNAALDAAIAAFWEIRNVGSKEARAFADQLIRGNIANLSEIDELLVAALENYKLTRLTVVDRNLLRLAIYEMAFGEHIPAPAAINEAIEVAKRFGSEESPRFVNGVLDRVLKELPAK